MDEKRYYWLKLKENYFDSPKIKKLRKIAGGDTYTIIYLKMQLLSISNGGIINYEGIELSFEEELALKLDEQLEDVQLTLAYLKQQMLIEESDESYLLIEACNNIGSEGQSAERKRRFDARKNERALLGNGSVTNEKRNSISNSISNNTDNNMDSIKVEKKDFNEYKQAIFERIWKFYPRKVKKQLARKTWDKKFKALNTKEDIDTKAVKIKQLLMAHIEAWSKEKGNQGEIGRPTQFIPHFSSWLNDEIPDK